MRKYLIPFLLLIAYNVSGQQLANWSSYYENGFIWNPALTAKWSEVEFTMTHRADWTGFDDAPVTSTIGIQVPFLKKVTRVAMGGYASRDNVGPFTKYSMAFTYNYRIAPELFGNSLDQLRLGLSANVLRYQYNPNKLNPYGAFTGDVNILEAAENGFGTNITVGAFYLSIDDFHNWKSHYYLGFSFNQILPTKLGKNFLGDISATPHATLNVGYRHLPYKRANYFIEPNILATYGFSKAINVMLNLRYEQKDAFWMTGGIVSNGEAFLQAGVILTEDSFMGELAGNGNFRIGAKADYSVLKLSGNLGIGYEFYLAYFISRD